MRRRYHGDSRGLRRCLASYVTTTVRYRGSPPNWNLNMNEETRVISSLEELIEAFGTPVYPTYGYLAALELLNRPQDDEDPEK